MEAKDWKVGDILRVKNRSDIPHSYYDGNLMFTIDHEIDEWRGKFMLRDDKGREFRLKEKDFHKLEFVRRPIPDMRIDPSIATEKAKEVQEEQIPNCSDCGAECWQMHKTSCPQCAPRTPVVKESLIAETPAAADFDLELDLHHPFAMARIAVEIDACKHIREIAKIHRADALACITEQIQTLENLKRELGVKTKAWRPKAEGVEPVIGRFGQ